MEGKGSGKNQQHTLPHGTSTAKRTYGPEALQKKCPYCSFEVLYSLFWQIVVEDNPHVLAL